MNIEIDGLKTQDFFLDLCCINTNEMVGEEVDAQFRFLFA